MKHASKLLLLGTLAACMGLAGCSDAERAKFGAYGKAHTITLYSGGRACKVWTSTGAIENEEHSDGYFFRDEKSGRLVRVSGDVVIETDG